MKQDRSKLALRAGLCVLVLALAGCVGGARVNQPELSTVESDPAGASVFVEGGFVGTTPASFYLPAKDRVDLRLEMAGYLPLEDVVVRRKDVPPDAEEGVGWEELYYYSLTAKQ